MNMLLLTHKEMINRSRNLCIGVENSNMNFEVLFLSLNLLMEARLVLHLLLSKATALVIFSLIVIKLSSTEI